MAKEFSRKVRVGNAIRKLIAPVIDRLSRDNGFGLVSVTEVDVAPDLKTCDIYISVFGSEEEQAKAVKFFRDNAGPIRSEVAQDLTMKRNPALNFKLDKGLENSDRLARLLQGEKTTE
ncbi:MAG: 30S ribosome-binding factor RbfA [Gammaproteobacteria bacterium]